VTRQAFGDARHQIIDQEFVQILVERAQRREENFAECNVGDDRFGDEWQRRTLSVETTTEQGRLEIEHPITQTVLGPCAAVVNLIGMQDHDLAGAADSLLAAIAKGLHAMQRHPDGVSVVTVRLEGLAVEMRFDPFDAGKTRRRHNLLAAVFARTFKTFEYPRH
jgi:hypothetical protein